MAGKTDASPGADGAASEDAHLSPRLETERLVLRTPTERDAADVYENHRHRSVAEGVISVPHPCPHDHGLAWIRIVRRAMRDTDLWVWVLEDRSTGRVIGDCGIEMTRRHRRGSLGYILHPHHQGKGLMAEALTRVLEHVFLEQPDPLWRIEADIYPGNDASFRLAERLGFEREGLLRGYFQKEGTPRDVERVALLREAFRLAQK